MAENHEWPYVRSTSTQTVLETPWLTMVHNWERYRPPSRPSAQDVANFEQRIRAHMDSLWEDDPDRVFQILLMGATPEIRSILADLPGVQVCLVDYMLDMILAMTNLMTASNPDEVWVKGDWTVAPLQKGGFDIVLSDLILANLPLEQQEAVMGRVAELLAPDGVWINRIDCIDEHTEFVALEQLLADNADITEVTPELVQVVRNQAGVTYWHEDSKFMSWHELGLDMERYISDGAFQVPGKPLLEVLLHEIWDITVPFDKVYWLRRRPELEEIFSQRFDITNRIWDSAYGANHERGYYMYDLKLKARP